MNLSAFGRLTHLRHHDDDTYEDLVVFQMWDRPESHIEVVVEHLAYENEHVREFRRDGLGLDPRLAEALVLMLWRSMIGGQTFGLASEILRQISDIRPMLRAHFYVADARAIERRMRAFRPVVAEGPDAIVTVID